MIVIRSLMARPLAAGLVALAIIAGPAWGQRVPPRRPPTTNPRTTGRRPDLRRRGRLPHRGDEPDQGKLSERGPAPGLAADGPGLPSHQTAREAIDADDTKEALKEVNKGREAIKAIRAMLPKATVRTKTTAPDGKVIYEDEREVQETRIPIYEGMLHAQTLAPILAARRNAMEVAGSRWSSRRRSPRRSSPTSTRSNGS